jgi:hypothetical protein
METMKSGLCFYILAHGKGERENSTRRLSDNLGGFWIFFFTP